MLLASPYQLVISDAHLMEMDDFSLLKRIRALETSVPVVVTASTSEKESARLALLKGAFDLILTPLEHEQTVVTIRLALWQSKLMDLIAHKEKTLEKYRQHLAVYPDNRKSDENFNRALLSLEKTVSAFEETIQRVEESIRCFADLAEDVEHQVRTRALERLDRLSCFPR
jgi:DNA-binding NtrC family response regulator